MKLTDRQIETLKKHTSHHSKKYMQMMKQLMQSGKSFTMAYKITMEKIGK